MNLTNIKRYYIDKIMALNPVPNKHFAVKPYRAELFAYDNAGVMNANGINCLTCKLKPGAVLSSYVVCLYLAKLWNEN